jgi:O-succinylbenzoic acid--CoA ligase
LSPCCIFFISGGENIYPYEIETIAKTHKEINDAVCIAKEDATWGQGIRNDTF